MLLHNWGTGNEKRDFARDENRTQKPLSYSVSRSLLPGGALAPRRPLQWLIVLVEPFDKITNRPSGNLKPADRVECSLK